MDEVEVDYEDIFIDIGEIITDYNARGMYEQRDQRLKEILDPISDKDKFWSKFLDGVKGSDGWEIDDLMIVGDIIGKKFNITSQSSE